MRGPSGPLRSGPLGHQVPDQPLHEPDAGQAGHQQRRVVGEMQVDELLRWPGAEQGERWLVDMPERQDERRPDAPEQEVRQKTTEEPCSVVAGDCSH